MTRSASNDERDETRTGDAPAAHLEDLRVAFGATSDATPVLRGVDLSLARGQVLALVGESGSGKSLTSLALLGLLPRGARITAGTIRLEDRDVATFTDEQWRAVRGARVAMVFQDPMAALNPSFTVGWQVAEPLRRHRGDSRRAARSTAVDLMRTVGIPDAETKYDAYPHELSGGMRQRAVIAMALALSPTVLVADEPTTALDVTVQAQILRLLAERQRETGLSLLIVSHDLGVVARIAQAIAVMYAGRVVEHGPLDDVYRRPAHPYTLGLLEAVPNADTEGGRLPSIPGQPPDPHDMPAGCAFHPRCRFATDACRTDDPPPRRIADGRTVACHHAEDVLAETAEESR